MTPSGSPILEMARRWASHPDLVRLCGAVPVIVPCSAESGFRLAPDALEAAMTERTRWVVLNAPGNPSGATLEAGCATVPGSAFGAPGHLRLSFATDIATLEEGCRIVVATLDGIPT
ncbi:aminotransferase class I/II-fold pyridoxal phosphate-dependent enzyme [Streptomyces sioyaensis]|uniref:aminotransferase class I/II-fold pyridoxal phosphate-dependent enzyme n=1 Tax=Streptomyces sioyaensis TaxID=67364 RepID=UPI003716AA24